MHWLNGALKEAHNTIDELQITVQTLQEKIEDMEDHSEMNKELEGTITKLETQNNAYAYFQSRAAINLYLIMDLEEAISIISSTIQASYASTTVRVTTFSDAVHIMLYISTHESVRGVLYFTWIRKSDDTSHSPTYPAFHTFHKPQKSYPRLVRNWFMIAAALQLHKRPTFQYLPRSIHSTLDHVVPET